MNPAQFWDRRAEAYAKKPVPDRDAYERTLERVRVHLRPNDRVLELGCGTGTTALKLAPSAGEIVATDYSAKMIAIARAKANLEGGRHVRFQQCTLEDSLLTPSSFDVVMAMNFLHLLEEIPARLLSIRELLRPGGKFISKTPCVGDRAIALRMAIRLLRAVGLAPFVNCVTERSLVDDVEAAGFTVEETGMYPKKSRSLLIVARRAA